MVYTASHDHHRHVRRCRPTDPCFYSILLANLLRLWSGGEALCPAGFRPPDCMHQCPQGQFGMGCASQCPVTCYTPSCKPDTGTCFRCRLGFRGPRCNTMCQDGLFGQDCMHRCGRNCLGLVCDPFTGACIACEPGFFGTRCDQIGPPNQDNALMNVLLSDLRERANSSDPLVSLAKLVANAEREKPKLAVGNDEREAFFTVVFLICSVLPICLVGACLYLLKEKIKHLYGGLLSKKRWVKTRDGFFTRTIIPTSKSQLIRNQPRGRFKAPFVKLIPEENTGGNHEVESQTKDSGYLGNRGIVSLPASKTNKGEQVKDAATSTIETLQTNTRLSSSMVEVASGDVNRHHRAVQSEASAWTADMATTVPVGHQDRHLDGFTVRSDGFWRRVLNRIHRGRSGKQNWGKNGKGNVGEGRSSSETFVKEIVSTQPEAILEVATESSSGSEESSSGSSTNSSTTTDEEGEEHAIHDIFCNTEQTRTMNTSPARKRRWKLHSISKFLGVGKSSKNPVLPDQTNKQHYLSYPGLANVGPARLGSNVPASGYGDQCAEGAPMEHAGPHSALSNHPHASPKHSREGIEASNKLFELLKSNILRELQHLQAIDTTNVSADKSVSDHVLAKSTQAHWREYPRELLSATEKADFRGTICSHDYQDSGLRKGTSAQPPLTLRHIDPEVLKKMLRWKQTHKHEETKSVASTSKIMTLKLRMAKMFGRFSGRKLRRDLLSQLEAEVTDPSILHERPNIRPDIPPKQRVMNDTHSQVSHQNLADASGRCYAELNPLLRIHRERHVQTDPLTSQSKLSAQCMTEREKDRELPRRKSTQCNTDIDKAHFEPSLACLGSLEKLKSLSVNPQRIPAALEYISLLGLNTPNPSINCPQNPEPTGLDSRSKQVHQSMKAPAVADVSTSPCCYVDASDQTSPMAIGNNIISNIPMSNKIFASHTASNDTCTVNAAIHSGLRNHQTLSELYAVQNDCHKAAVKMCERGHSPGMVGLTGSRQTPTASITGNGECTFSSFKSTDQEPTCGKRRGNIGVAEGKMDNLDILKLAQNFLGNEASSLFLSAREWDKHTGDPKEKTCLNTEANTQNLTKSVTWKKGKFGNDSLNAVRSDDHRFRKTDSSEEPQQEVVIQIKEKQATYTKRPVLNDQNKTEKCVQQPRSKLTANKESTSDCKPAKETSIKQHGQISMSSPYVTDTESSLVNGNLLKLECPDQTFSDKVPASTSITTPRQTPLIVGPNNFHLSCGLPEPNIYKKEQIKPNGQALLQQLNSRTLECVRRSENISTTRKECDGIFRISDACFSKIIPENGNPLIRSSTVMTSPKLARLVPPAVGCTRSPETMTSSDSKMRMSLNSVNQCVIVHDFETSANSDFEQSDRKKQTDCESSCYKEPATTPKSVERSQSYTLENNLENCIFRQTSSEKKNVSEVLCTDKKAETVRPCGANDVTVTSVSTDVVGVTETQRGVGTRKVTHSSDGKTLITQQENKLVPKRQPSNLIQISTCQKLLPQKQKHPLKRIEEGHSPHTNLSKDATKEGDIIPTTDIKTLPVPTLLEHSLQPAENSVSLNIAKKLCRPKFPSTSASPGITAGEMTVPHGPSLRDSEDFRSIQEPSSERYYDALEPDPAFWSRLQHRVKSPSLTTTSRSAESPKTSKASKGLAVSSSRRSRRKFKGSEEEKSSSQSVLRFAAQDRETKPSSEKGKARQHGAKEDPGTKIVLRFAQSPTGREVVSTRKKPSRSSSCKRNKELDTPSKESRGKKRNQSVEPDSKRQKHEVENCPRSDNSPKQLKDNTNFVYSKSGTSNGNVRDSSKCRPDTSFKEIVRIETGLIKSTAPDPKIVIEAGKGNHETPEKQSLDNFKKQDFSEYRPNNLFPSQVSDLIQKSHQAHQALSCPLDSLFLSESKHPLQQHQQLCDANFPQPAVDSIRTLHSAQPVPSCCESNGCANHSYPGARQASLPVPNPSVLVPVQNMVSTRAAAQSSAPAVAYSVPQPGPPRRIFTTQTFQNPVTPATMGYPPTNAYAHSLRPGATVANTLNPSHQCAGLNSPNAVSIGSDPMAFHIGPYSRSQDMGLDPRALHIAQNPRAVHISPDSRGQHIGTDQRALSIGLDSRALQIGQDPRTLHISPDSRSLQTGPDQRALHIDPDSRVPHNLQANYRLVPFAASLSSSGRPHAGVKATASFPPQFYPPPGAVQSMNFGL